MEWKDTVERFEDVYNHHGSAGLVLHPKFTSGGRLQDVFLQLSEVDVVFLRVT